jgi:hypothetical protein
MRGPEAKHERVSDRFPTREHAQIGEEGSFRFGQPVHRHRKACEDVRVRIVGKRVGEKREIGLLERLEQVSPRPAAARHRAAHRGGERQAGTPLRDLVCRAGQRLHARPGPVRELPQRRVGSERLEEMLACAQAASKAHIPGRHEQPATGAEPVQDRFDLRQLARVVDHHEDGPSLIVRGALAAEQFREVGHRDLARRQPENPIAERSPCPSRSREGGRKHRFAHAGQTVDDEHALRTGHRQRPILVNEKLPGELAHVGQARLEIGRKSRHRSEVGAERRERLGQHTHKLVERLLRRPCGACVDAVDPAHFRRQVLHLTDPQDRDHRLRQGEGVLPFRAYVVRAERRRTRDQHEARRVGDGVANLLQESKGPARHVGAIPPHAELPLS